MLFHANIQTKDLCGFAVRLVSYNLLEPALPVYVT
jgi:hypothetical protein